MLSKKNYQEKLRKMEPRKERFSIRKFSIGAASVLIGFTIFGLGTGSKNVKADVIKPNETITAAVKTSSTNNSEQNSNSVTKNVNVDTKAENNTQINRVSTDQLESKKLTSNTVNKNNSETKENSNLNNTNLVAQEPSAQAEENTESQSVSDYSEFLSALRNSNINTIKLAQNINFNNVNLNNGNYETINNSGIARKVIIDVQNQYALNMGNDYVDFKDSTHYGQNTSKSWNVVLKDLSLQTVSGYGPFWFDNSTSNNDAITFDGVTTTKDSGQLLNNSTTNVNFEGNNNLQGNLTNSNTSGNAVFQANNINFLNGSTTLAANNNTSSKLSDIRTSGNVVVNNGAKVDFNSANTSNMAGITIPDDAGAGSQNIDNATSGVVRLMPNAQVTMELGSGSSMGIMNASDVDLQDNSSLRITTSKMNVRGWRSAGLVDLDYDGDTDDNTVRIGKNALLSIIRTEVTSSDSPLIAMGPHNGLGETYHLEINGGSLNLEDSSYSDYLPSTYKLSFGSYSSGWPAMITMWGTSSQDYINFNNAKLVNLQRTAANKPGYLIKTEGAGDFKGHQTHIVINSEDTNYNTPLTMIPANSTEPMTWNIKYLNNTSQGGDLAYAFRSHRSLGSWNQVGSEYMNGSVNDNSPAKGVNEVTLTSNPYDKGSNSFSNGAVVPEGNETTATNALNSFINHFSWWNTSGVKFGSDLDTNNQYTPFYKPVTVEQGKSATVDPTFTNKDGKEVEMPEGTRFAGTEETPTWSKIDPATGKVTLTPTANTNPGAYNIPVTITYLDGSTAKANIPVVVTKGTQTVIWNNNNATVITIDRTEANAHETSDNSQVISAKSMIASVESYSIDQDDRISTTPTIITNYKADWEKTPNTVVETATADGKNIVNNVINITIDGKTDKTNPFDINAKGAGARSLTKPIDILEGSDLTTEQFDALVQNNIPSSEIKSTAWQTKPTQNQNGIIRITFNDKDSQGQNTYLDINIPASSVNITPVEKDSEKYHITYPHLSIERPDSGQNTDSVNPTTSTDMPTGEVTSYKIGTFTAPTGVTINVNQTTGNVSETVGSDAQLGSFNVPVIVTFKDGSSKVIDVPSSVTGMDHKHDTYYGDQTMTSFTAPVASVHKTSVDFTPSVNGSAIDVIKVYSDWNGNGNSVNDYKKVTIYKVSADGKYFVNQSNSNDNFATSSITYSWINNLPGVSAPNTNVTNFTNGSADTLYQLPNGELNPAEQTTEEESLPGNSKWRSSFTINNADVVSKLGLGVNTYSNWLNTYFNFYGATSGSALNFKQNSNISDLTQEQYRTLVNISSLGREGWNGQNINPNAPEVLAYIPGTDNSKIFSMFWAPNEMPSTKQIANNVPGTVRIVFNDGTYLDVKADINVEKDENANKPDNQKTSFDQQISYQYKGKEVAAYIIQNIVKGSSLTDEQLKDIINNNLPANYSIVDGYSYPSAEDDITSQPAVLIVPVTQDQKQHDNSDYNATVVVKYINAETKVAMQTKNGQNELTFNFNKNQGLKASTLKAVIDSEVPINWKVDPTFVYPDDQTGNNTIIVPLVHATKDITPTTPGVNPNDPKYKDMFTQVSRDIYQTKPGEKEQLIDTQTVDFGRNGVEDLVTGEVTGVGAWEVGKIDNNKFILGGKAEYPAALVEQISGYDSYVDGTKASEVSSASALENGTPIDGKAVYITYEKSIPENPYDPSNKDMNKDVVRTIIINRIDGTTETITQTVHFVRGGEGENVEADTPWTVGVRDGNTWKSTGEIKGTWPEYNIPQVTDYTSIVDGKDAKAVLVDNNVIADTANEKVIVAYTKTTTSTDADKYSPEGQEVHTTPGVVPPAENGIKNKEDLPSGTKYTWEKTPDVSKAGKTTGTVIVTYPDGSKDKVDVPIVIGNPTTTPDSDKYNPEGQEVHTTPGKEPNASDGIKNKEDLPSGTKYTWEKTPDVTKPGKTTGTVIVTYPDGSKDKVDVPIIIDNPAATPDSDKYSPEGQEVHTTPGKEPNASDGIKNKEDLPSGTKYTWEKTPDVTKPGKTTGTVIVTYPDGSKDKVDVPIIIDNPAATPDSDKYSPEGQEIHTTPGKEPSASDGIKNKEDLPSGTKYTWEKTPDVSKAGKTTGNIIVTYPDGSTDKVDVPIVIGKSHVTPESQPIHTTPGNVPNPSEGIKNRNDLPSGTKYTWKVVPNVATIGEYAGIVTVTYPDGLSVNVSVKIFVDGAVTSKTISGNSESNTAKAATVNESQHTKADTLPQTGAKSENEAGILGLAIAAVGSLFGLGVDEEKHQK